MVKWLIGWGAIGVLIACAATSASRMNATTKVERTYWPNGRVLREHRFDGSGALHGPLRRFDEAGELVEEIQFDHGEWVSSKSYHADGTVLSDRREGADYIVK